MSSTAFVVTVHAFERIEERFPKLICDMAEIEQARLMHREIMEALDAGRFGAVPPVELASRSPSRWVLRKRGLYAAWTEDKNRGYILQEHVSEGLLVVTVLAGKPWKDALTRRLHRGQRRNRAVTAPAPRTTRPPRTNLPYQCDNRERREG